MPDRLVVDLSGDGQVAVTAAPDGGFAEEVSRVSLAWPLDAEALEDLRWYLEDYLLAPYGVWEDRGPDVQQQLAGWGKQVFEPVFGDGPARFAYERARDRGLEVVFRSDDPALLGLPWELMRDGAGPVALGAGGISRTLKVADAAGTLEVPGGKLRVLMVISRPAGAADVGYQMVARPLLERLDAVRGEVSLTVLRPPTFDALRDAVRKAADAGEPFHVVHFDGHGVYDRKHGLGELCFENPEDSGLLEKRRSDRVPADHIAAVVRKHRVPLFFLDACQTAKTEADPSASVAGKLLESGVASVAAMSHSVLVETHAGSSPSSIPHC